MRVYGMSELQIIAIAHSLEMYPEWRRYGGKRAPDERQLALRPLNERFSVLLEEEVLPLEEPSLRAQYVVCMHGHEAFIRALLEGGARLVTTPIARYTSAQQMEEIQPSIRKAYRERYGEDPCGCETA